MKKVFFKLNKKLDKEILLDFLSAQEGGVDFGAGIRALHPKLRGRKPTKTTISKYVDAYYKEHAAALEKTREKFEKEWGSIEKNYFIAVERLFGKTRTPKRGYRAFLSIADCNPRFLETKSFQVYWKHRDGVRFVVAHEILHFFFFDYVRRYLPKLYKKPMLWDVSEIFNSIILSEPMFVKIHGVKRAITYPEHKKFIARARRVWRKNLSIKSFVEVLNSLLEG